MSKINSRVATFAIVVLSLGFAATGAAPALANVGPTVHRHVAYQLARRGYAGELASHAVAKLQFAPGRGIDGASCALPSSGCPDDERITN